MGPAHGRPGALPRRLSRPSGAGRGRAAVLLGFLRMPRLAREQPERQRGGRPWPAILRQPVAVVATSGAAIGYGAMILAMTAAPLAMVQHHHSVEMATFAIQAHVLGMFAPSFITGALIQRVGVLRVMAAGTLLIAGHVAIAVSAASSGCISSRRWCCWG